MDDNDWFDMRDNDDRCDHAPFDEDQGGARQRKPMKVNKAGSWQSADGRVIAFKDMEHTHLLNAIAYLERQYRQTQDTFCDGALDIDLLYPAHAGLVAEASRRRLIPKSKQQLVTR
jgi:hypothetical protein